MRYNISDLQGQGKELFFMKDLEHASINGVEIHNLAEQDNDETLLYSGDIWMDGRQIGRFAETDSGMEVDVDVRHAERPPSSVRRNRCGGPV